MEHLAKQEIISIVVTFIFGFIAGGYLYINHFTSMVSPDEVQNIDEVSQFTIVSEAYGGCRSDCPAFQVSQDGTFRYRFSERIGAAPTLIDGTLPRSIQKNISSSVSAAVLARQSRAVNPTNCPSFEDGIDIRYNILYEGVEYELDSCGTAVEFSGDSWQALSAIWTYLGSVQ